MIWGSLELRVLHIVFKKNVNDYIANNATGTVIMCDDSGAQKNKQNFPKWPWPIYLAPLSFFSQHLKENSFLDTGWKYLFPSEKSFAKSFGGSILNLITAFRYPWGLGFIIKTFQRIGCSDYDGTRARTGTLARTKVLETFVKPRLGSNTLIQWVNIRE